MNIVPRATTVLPAAALLLPVLCSCDRSGLTDGPKIPSKSAVNNPGGNSGDPGGNPTGQPPPPAPKDLLVKINEVMVQNVAAYADEDGKFSPWIELYNTTDQEMSLQGVGLTDDLSKPEKWKVPYIPQAKIPPHGYLVIFLDGDTADENDLHASFTLAAKPFSQLMVNKGSDILFIDLSKPKVDESSGRTPDGGDKVAVLSEPTPGAPNKEAAGPPLPSEGSFLRGDANGDSRLNISDMTAILKVLFQSGSFPSCQDRMDANDDGRVNLTDVLYIGQALYQRGPPFPAPYPQAGTDPTGDTLPCPLP